MYSAAVADYLVNLIENSSVRYIAAFALIFILVMILGTVLNNLLSRLLNLYVGATQALTHATARAVNRDCNFLHSSSSAIALFSRRLGGSF